MVRQHEAVIVAREKAHHPKAYADRAVDPGLSPG